MTSRSSRVRYPRGSATPSVSGCLDMCWGRLAGIIIQELVYIYIHTHIFLLDFPENF